MPKLKTAFVCFTGTDVSLITDTFMKNGVEITTAAVLSATDDIGFRRSYETFRDTADILIISAGGDFNVKEVLADAMGVPLAENENAVKTLESAGITDASFALMPVDATYLPNETGDFQGFIAEDAEFTLAVLPQDEKQFLNCCKKYLLPYISAKCGVTDKAVFKCFGEKDGVIDDVKTVAEEFSDLFDYCVYEKNCDITITVFFYENGERKRDALRKLAETLGGAIYAERDVSLSETLFTLLRLSGKKIAVAESFTGGRLAQNIVKNSGASEFFCEGVVAYSDESKVKRLNVPYEDVLKNGAVSAKVAYRMAAGLFSASDCDVAVATTGLAGPNGDGSGKPVGTCFIAAGTRNGIHTYGFEFSGDREEITEKGVNAALFYAVKTIKNN